MEASFVVLVPVKPPEVGKSRLAGAGEVLRQALAVAFARDTLAAARATPGVVAVVAVTDSTELAGRAGPDGYLVHPDAGELNAALRAAAQHASASWPDATPVALCADLPALTPQELSEALRAAPVGVPAFVADSAGVGTTTYLAPYDAFAPAFGEASRAAHLAAGAVEITGDLPGLRLDVDDPADLERAVVAGVGPNTAQALAVRT